MKSYSLGDIASRLNLRLIGDPDCQIQGLEPSPVRIGEH